MWKLTPFVLLLLLFPASRRVLAAGLGGVLAVWRPTSGVLAVVALTAAAVLAIREDWLVAAVMAALAAGLALAARARATPAASAPAYPQPAPMSARDARSILGVPEGADRTTVEAAFRRLIRLAHPDRGGTAGLAAQLNAARATLLRS